PPNISPAPEREPGDRARCLRGSAVPSPAEPRSCGYCAPSAATIKARDFVDSTRSLLTATWAGDSFQLVAFDMLSNAMITKRKGATPSMAVMSLVRVM